MGPELVVVKIQGKGFNSFADNMIKLSVNKGNCTFVLLKDFELNI